MRTREQLEKKYLHYDGKNVMSTVAMSKAEKVMAARRLKARGKKGEGRKIFICIFTFFSSCPVHPHVMPKDDHPAELYLVMHQSF